MRQRILAALGPLLGVTLLSLAVVVLRHEFEAYRLRDVLEHLREIPVRGLALAFLLTAGSYSMLTGYDALALLYARRPLPYRRVALVSFVAYAFSHSIGLSFFSASAVRYRVLSGWGVRPQEIARVVAFTPLTFWLGFLLLGGIVHVTWPLAIDLPGVPFTSSRPVGILLLAALVVYTAALVWRRREPLRLGGFRVELPGLRMTGAQLALSSADWLLASSVLYAVLPPESHVAPQVLLGAYLIAIVAGLVSHVPGGLGVFETVMVVLMRPHLPGDQVLAAIVAFRIVYYLIPMAVAVALFAGYEIHQGGARLARADARGTSVASENVVSSTKGPPPGDGRDAPQRRTGS